MKKKQSSQSKNLKKINYDIFRPWLTLDPWQKDYIDTDGNCFLVCGRQSGKSAAASIKVGKRAATRTNRRILMIAFTENQAYQLFFKTLIYLRAVYPQMIKGGKDKPTKHVIKLKNGSEIYCYAAGQYGDGLRGFTITDLFIDEAAPMAKEVFTAVSPMLSVTGGTMDILSTPRGKTGFFYECSLRDDFTKFKISAYDCPRHSKEFLESEREAMSELEFAQEYLAEFLDDLKRVFSDEWINKVCVLKRPERIELRARYYLGVDIARLGDDESSFEIVKKIDNDNIIQVESIVTRKKRLTETEMKILELENLYKFREIYIDAGSGSMGVSVLDHLLEEPKIRGKVVAISNRERILDEEGNQKKKIMKEELYHNLVWLGESNKIKLLDDNEIKLSLASIQFEYVNKAGSMTMLRIFGKKGRGGDHIAEGLIRAAYCIKDKKLRLWVR